MDEDNKYQDLKLYALELVFRYCDKRTTIEQADFLSNQIYHSIVNSDNKVAHDLIPISMKIKES